MEIISDFSVIKQKIIKTNDLFKLYLEKEKELKNAQSLCKRLNNNILLSKEEISKLKLKNDSLLFSLNKISKEYEPLNREHSELKWQFNNLENDYHEAVNKWQIKYQSANQELVECNQKLRKLQEQETETVVRRKVAKKSAVDDTKLVAERDKLRDENKRLEATVCSLNTQLSEYKKYDFSKLTDRENELTFMQGNIIDLQRELNDTQRELKLKQEQNAHLHAKLEQTENDKIKCHEYLTETENLQKLVQQCKLENGSLKKHKSELQEVISKYKKEPLTNTNRIQELEVENESLKTQNLALNKEISDLHNRVTEKTALDTPGFADGETDNDVVPTDEEIATIIRNTCFPMLLAPLSDDLGEENGGSLLPRKEVEINEIGVLSEAPPASLNYNRQISSSSGDFMVTSYDDVVNVPKPTTKTNKKTKTIKKKKVKKVDLFGALLALKKANINFTISSESLLERHKIKNSFFYPPITNTVQSTVQSAPAKYVSDSVTDKLKCSLGCCKKNSYLLLKKSSVDEDRPFVGFFTVKKECASRSSSRLGNHSDNTNNQIRRRKHKNAERSFSEILEEKLLHRIGRQSQRNNNNNNNNNRKIHADMEPFLSEMYANTIPERTSSEKLTKKTQSLDIEDKRSSETDSGVGSDILETSESMNNTNGGSESLDLNAHITNCTNNVKGRKRKVNNKNNSESSFKKICKANTSHKVITPKRKVGRPRKNTNNTLATDTAIKENDDSKLDKLEKTKLENEVEAKKIVKNSKIPKSPKASFKRPTCRTRQSSRLIASKTASEKTEELLSRPASPPTCEKFGSLMQPKIIPLEKVEQQQESPTCKIPLQTQAAVIPLEEVAAGKEKMPASKIKMLFEKLVNFSKEEKALDEVVEAFISQDPEYIAQAILEKVAKDIHDIPDSKYSPAPIMTETQRVMLGFMCKLEKNTSCNISEIFLTLAERRLLCCKDLQEIAPITRLCLAICKLKMYLHRMRKLCCDVFYFCGDFAVPFLFIVLTSWSEVLPHESESQDVPLVKVLVQIIYMKECNTPGYNLLPLRNLLIQFYGYPTERWDSEELFQDLLQRYLRNPVRSADFALLLFCKNHPEKWVHNKIEQSFQPLVERISSDNFKAAVIILIGNLSSQFTSKSEVNYMTGVKAWMRTLITETTPDVVRRSVYLCIKRLKKK